MMMNATPPRDPQDEPAPTVGQIISAAYMSGQETGRRQRRRWFRFWAWLSIAILLGVSFWSNRFEDPGLALVACYLWCDRIAREFEKGAPR